MTSFHSNDPQPEPVNARAAATGAVPGARPAVAAAGFGGALRRAFRLVGVVFGGWLAGGTLLAGYSVSAMVRGSSLDSGAATFGALAVTCLPPLLVGLLLMLPWSRVGTPTIRRALFIVLLLAAGLFIYQLSHPASLLWLSSMLWFTWLDHQIFCVTLMVWLQLSVIGRGVFAAESAGAPGAD